MHKFFRRIRYLTQHRRLDRELASDMEFHREMAARAGGPTFGNALQLREEARDAWGWTWIERLGQDLQYAARILRKSPGFTLAAVLMLAIGIGVNVAVFSFFDLMVLRPLPVRDPATLVRFHRRAPRQYAFTLPYPEMAFFREHSRTLSAVLALNLTRLAMEGEAKPLDAHFVSANFFDELGVTPLLGRMLEPALDDNPGAEPVVVLSYGFWRRHFGADASIAGKTIRLNAKPVTVVGVAPAAFSGLSLDKPDLWAPITQQPRLTDGSQLLTDFSADGGGVQMWGRLREGVTSRAAEQELQALATELHARHPNEIWEKEGLPSQPGGYATSLMVSARSGTGSEGSDELYPIFALVGALALLILAVACGNLGSLLLARGVNRQREIGIRIAIGAGRVRLIRQLFTESLLLAFLGSAAGLALGYVVLRSLMILTGAPAWPNPAPDGPVVVFALLIGFFAAVLFGLTPAWQTARQRHRATMFRQVLVGAQVAASCVLLIVAGLLVRALNHVMSADPGFAYQKVIAIDPGLATHGYSAARAVTYFEALGSRVRALPGVESVSLTPSPPLGRRRETAGVELEGRPLSVQINRVDPAFFATMKIPLLRGRNLRPGDTHAIVISESLARKWPTGDPLGGKFSMGSDYIVVGVAGSARLIALENSDAVEVYLLADRADTASDAMLVETTASPEALARSVADLAAKMDPGVFPEIQLLKTSFREKLEPVESGALVVGVLSFIAQLLACLGIVGVVSYAVSQRVKEIAIRMALGARPSNILSVVLRQFSWPVLGGLAVGVAAAAGMSQILRQVLYGVSNLDPLAYGAAIALFAVTSAVAALWPARRALRVDPMRALRQD